MDDDNDDPYCLEDYNLSSEQWMEPVLKEAALSLKLARPRSCAWAIMLQILPCPADGLINKLREARTNYKELKSKFTKNPHLVLDDDPLSQKDESAWNQHFCDNELRELILQDVIRTFPDELYFRDKDVQNLMVRVLFVWARCNPHIGYRQGMHEILAPLLSELHIDRKCMPALPSDMLSEILNPKYMEHDSFMLFAGLMKGMAKFYCTGDAVPSSTGRLAACTSPHMPNEAVKYLRMLNERLLVPLDPALASHLCNCNVSLELFGIRWLRLLFGREFPRSEMSNLWGVMFAQGPQLPLIDFIFVSMLISMRNTLLVQDPGLVLAALMRPNGLNVGHIVAMALHLYQPLMYPRPLTPPPSVMLHPLQTQTSQDKFNSLSNIRRLEERGRLQEAGDYEDEEGLAEGADVARELATLALLRAQLPPAAAALAKAIPKPPNAVAQPLGQILQLSSLLLCRNHALVDVETALEADEGHSTILPGKHRMVPVNIVQEEGVLTSNRSKHQQLLKSSGLKEVPLKVFKCTTEENTLPHLDELNIQNE